jgi:hypothetical protein
MILNEEPNSQVSRMNPWSENDSSATQRNENEGLLFLKLMQVTHRGGLAIVAMRQLPARTTFLRIRGFLKTAWHFKGISENLRLF